MPVEITGMGSELQGVGKLPDGRTAFIPGAIMSEVVDVRIVRDKGRYCEAELVGVITPSPCRITPACPYAGVCGGCAAAHMTYEASLEAKQLKVVQALERIGGFHGVAVADTIGMENPFRYRNKAEYAISGGKIGLRPASSRAIVEIDDCLIQQSPSIEAMRIVRKWLKRRAMPVEGWLVTRTGNRGELMCVLSCDQRPGGIDELAGELFAGINSMRSFYTMQLRPRPNSALDGICMHVAGDKNLEMSLGGLKFIVGPMSFFQVNIEQAQKLYALAVEFAGVQGGNAIDAYCGVGSITLNLARTARMTIGVERVPEAIDDAKENARINGLSDAVRFIAADAVSEIPRLLRRGFKPDAIVVDPPRKGIDKPLADAILKSDARRVVYVSCDPATMARDASRLVENGEYEIRNVVPVDMFANTSHVETVVLMSKVDR
ncbi:MAG: 23S rRNA (uracil(1939)-C(5))-methyltransferase RlmD [Clostridia bacterium]|nr:23S rRNA (uracil(1939)-C(5))-methyltransferase RlmD [Clostridia bacterium]